MSIIPDLDLGPVCFESPTPLNITVAAVIILGTVVSYVPQYVAIVRKKSSEGLNTLMLTIALAGSFLTATNSGILKWNLVSCCQNLGVGECVLNNLATEQLVSALLCVLILYIIFLRYFPMHPSVTQTREKRVRERLIAWILFIVTDVIGIFIAVLAGVLYYNVNLSPNILSHYAETLGYLSALGILIQWSPQIWTTWKLQSAGCLSLVMLCIQMPGALLVVFFQGILNHAHFTTWAPYILGAIQQTILIVMIIIFYLRDKRRLKTDPTNYHNSAEAQPLIVTKSDSE